ncbi:unnamed protein product [Bemisia tabaci]|uniref:Mannosyltransferase n=1 Tax=Bemisia tabaci TaxID=7038 RepID=A0A9P0CAR5_BEMTA|nr:unnamed protein product [Bemisia tabaci]
MQFDLILFISAAFHLCLCPFTKVEESFNLQAIHDILYLKANFSEYDHHVFPGVVPRTFIGPLVTSALAAPLVFLLQFQEMNKFFSQIVVRAVFGSCVLFSLMKLKRTIIHIFGTHVAKWFVLISASQFHFMFYLTRTLPNIMALPLVLMALHWWIRRQYMSFLWASAAAVIIFRFELALFFGFLVLFELFYRRISLLKVLRIGIPAGIVCLIITVGVDSFMWQRPLWPEGEVLYFNLILNRSSEWGTSPFLWYFYSAIPRGLAFSLIFAVLGAFFDSRIRRLLIPPILFVFAYSFLPHKELRFIIYVFPVFNIAAAVACARLWMLRFKGPFRGFLSLAAASHLIGNVLFTAFLLSISATNYPGGYAISKLHQLESPDANVSVHITNLAAQTGVTRFTQCNSNWNYDKRENLTVDSPEFSVSRIFFSKLKLVTHQI